MDQIILDPGNYGVLFTWRKVTHPGPVTRCCTTGWQQLNLKSNRPLTEAKFFWGYWPAPGQAVDPASCKKALSDLEVITKARMIENVGNEKSAFSDRHAENNSKTQWHLPRNLRNIVKINHWYFVSVTSLVWQTIFSSIIVTQVKAIGACLGHKYFRWAQLWSGGSATFLPLGDEKSWSCDFPWMGLIRLQSKITHRNADGSKVLITSSKKISDYCSCTRSCLTPCATCYGLRQTYSLNISQAMTDIFLKEHIWL